MGDDDLALRLFLPTYFVAYVALLGPLRVRAFQRKYGFDPTALGQPDPVMALEESMRNLMFGIVLLMTAAWAAWPSVQDHLGPVAYLERGGVRLAAVVLLLSSLALVGTAQSQLGRSWRYGVDRSMPPDGLVTGGLFSLSRNPIYVGLILTTLGLFLALPNAVSLALVAAGWVMLRIRVAVEEEFLSERFGAEYDTYRARTPRWLPGMGS